MLKLTQLITILLFLWSAGAYALEIPAALKDVKRADSNCYRDDVALAEADLAAIRRKPDLRCTITVDELMKRNAKADSLMIDVRNSSEFADFHIAEAVNFSLTELKTKAFLKNKAVTLIGNGKGEQELYSACADLKAAGFTKVRVLRGGIAAWLAKQQPVMGKAPVKFGLAWLTPQELFQELSFSANVLLATSDARKIKGLLSAVVSIRNDQPGTIKASIKRQNKIPKASVILLASERFNRAQVGQIMETLNPIPVLIYAEPAAAYEQFIATQKAVWAAHENGPKRPLGCTSG